MLLALKVGIPTEDVISFIINGIPAFENLLATLFIGSNSTSDISTSGYTLGSSVNLSARIVGIGYPSISNAFVIALRKWKGIALARNSARLIASRSITSHNAWQIASSSTLPEARPFVW